MIPLPCRHKGGGPLLGARRPYERGPFGVRPHDDGQDDEHQDDDDT